MDILDGSGEHVLPPWAHKLLGAWISMDEVCGVDLQEHGPHKVLALCIWWNRRFLV